MRIAVMGAGAVGAYFGAKLSASGNDVAFLARGAHLDALRRDGLRVDSPGGDLRIQNALFTNDPGEVAAVDLILFCVKSYDTDAAVGALAPMIGAPRRSCRYKTASTTRTRSRRVGVSSILWPASPTWGRNSSGRAPSSIRRAAGSFSGSSKVRCGIERSPSNTLSRQPGSPPRSARTSAKPSGTSCSGTRRFAPSVV